MWSALYPISNHCHIRQLQFATHAFSQQVLQQAVQIKYMSMMNSHGHSHGERTWQKLRSNIAVYFILFNSWIREARLLKFSVKTV